MNSFLAGFLGGLPLMLIVGPVAVLLWETGLERGFVGGWPAAAGVAAGDASFAAAAFFGGVWLQQVLNPVASGLHVLAVVVIGVVAVRLIRDARRELIATGRDHPASDRPDPTGPAIPCVMGSVTGSVMGSAAGEGNVLTHRRTAPGLSLKFWSLTMCNPLTIGLFSSLVLASGQAASRIGWPLGIASASVCAHLGFVGVGSGMRRTMTPRHTAWMRLAGGVFLTGLALQWALA